MLEDLSMMLLSDSRFETIEIINRVPADLLISADSHQIHQVFLNLLNNAADAMPEGGTVIIESHVMLNGSERFRKSLAVRISVTDSGMGIDADIAKHVFEPFWTSKAEGTGLGLAIIYRIIEAHGGSIRVETPPGGGCCFTIMLPV